ncbi:MAG: hypothetical protein PHW93_03110 [Candidatus Methanomethylophilaceae archaeon]|nr:hypothetical protein [Candidatus Methanomethylophilaceae archaeon]NBK24187.1 hypothetical protein [Spirochaetia bacterium]
MTEIILFTKQDCQKCDHIKERIPEGLKVEIVDAETVDGMAEAAYYEILEEDMPVLVVDEEVVTGAIKITSRLKELAGSI